MGYSIHFNAEKEPDKNRRILKLQLGKKHQDLKNIVKNTCSDTLKNMLEVGNYQQLKNKADKQRISVNSYALQKIAANLQPSQNKLVSGVEGTYRGDTEDFFHHLFPYLEAFSPNFVTAIHEKYAPNARILLDPFGGLGTAPFTFTKNSGKAYYCEVNPLMQRIAELKNKLRMTPLKERQALVIRIEDLRKGLAKKLKDCEPDAALLHNYNQAFGKSIFFANKTLDQVLRIRTYIDKLYCIDSLLAISLELCALSSLVPVSHMQRAGDLRFKRPSEREKNSEDLCLHVTEKLFYFEKGILTFDTINENLPQLIAEDSRNLQSIPSVGADIVITSPPYLNGTNYFRNTKIELWFIRVIQSKDDLGLLRNKAITAGINDVREARAHTSPSGEKFLSIEAAVQKLEVCAYDKRITQMVKWYAYDLNGALKGTIKHLKPNGIIAVDIGDSIYCDVKVPTDKLVEEILLRNNCEIIDILIVRKRTSRAGQEVKQVCVIGRKKGSGKSTVNNKKPFFVEKWSIFKETLPHTQVPYASRNWGHPNHSLCSYQGKLKPSIANFLVDAFVPKNGSVLDPFCGVGTIPFEAALSGKKAYGYDISPAALAISRAKLSLPEKNSVVKEIKNLEKYITEHKDKLKTVDWLPSFNKSLPEYYHSETMKEILCAREWFLKRRPWNNEVSLLLACCMHILHGNRPYALSRRSHPVTPFAPSGEFEYKSLIQKLKQKVIKSIEADFPTDFAEGKMFFQDATDTWPLEINQLDAIITSPPFYDSTRFHLANWIRLWFSGWNEYDFKHEQKRFIDEKQKTSFDCYNSIIRQSRERLKKDGVLVFHLGKSKKCDMAEMLLKIAQPWFSKYELFNESVVHCESHGIRDKGTVTDHQYLIFY